MIKYDVFDDYGKAVSQCRSTGMKPANYLLIAMFVQLCLSPYDVI
ncbi:hypothetical protein [Wolbachia endosymbiont of Tettigetta isshikii]